MTAAGLVCGVILAGGQARRMGGRDKGLVELNGKPLIQYALERLEPQVSCVVINANRNLDRYRRLGVPVVSDEVLGFAGPLAGIHSAMSSARTRFIATVACDSPFFPDALVARLYRGLEEAGAQIAVVNDGTRQQPVFALIEVALADSLAEYLDAGERKIDRWFERHMTVDVDFSDCAGAFENINTPEDLEHAASQRS